ISEWYYIERLEGRVVPPYEQWPIKYENPPAFDVVEATWREQMKNVRVSVAAQRDWNRKITYLSFPDDNGRRFPRPTGVARSAPPRADHGHAPRVRRCRLAAAGHRLQRFDVRTPRGG